MVAFVSYARAVSIYDVLVPGLASAVVVSGALRPRLVLGSPCTETESDGLGRHYYRSPTEHASPPTGPSAFAGAKAFEGAAKQRILDNMVSHVVALEYARAQLPAILEAFASFCRPPPPAASAAARRLARDRAPAPLSALGAALDVAVALLVGAFS